jgi:hypothetical protein
MTNPEPEEFAEATTWRPDQGEHPTTIRGTLKRVGTVDGLYGPYPLVEIEQDDGLAWGFHAFRDMARQELLSLKPQVGDRIAVHYGGRSEKGWYRYRVSSLDGKRAEVDWSRFGDDRAGQESLPTVDEPSSSAPVDEEPDGEPSAGETDDIPF